MSNLNSQQFSQQRGKHCLAYLRPVAANGEGLFVKPDINGESGVHVEDYAQLRQVIQGKSAHRFDYDSGEFKRARVRSWEHSDAMPDGGHQRRWRYPAGGGLEDAERI